MSQEDLAKKMGIHRSQISDYERNIRNYGIDTLRLFCTALNCSADDIVNVN
jgi:transcriptional regulator with XRE-family HTH domain